MDPPAEQGREPLPESIPPMLASLGKRLPRDEAAYAYELKWDGVRALAYCEPGRVRLESRTQRDITSQYPEVTRALREALGSREALIDGEVVAFDEEGRPDFQRLQRRMHVGSDSTIRRRMADTPATYIAFDLLHLEGHSLLDLPYADRRELLGKLDLDAPSLQCPTHHLGEAQGAPRAHEGARARGPRRQAARLRVPAGAPEPGLGEDQERPHRRPRRRRLDRGPGGSLGAVRRPPRRLLRRRRGPALRGPGRHRVHGPTLDDIAPPPGPLERDSSPFDGRQPPKESHFAEPALVARVEFNEWTNAGTLRAPSFKGLRDDIEPSAVRRSDDS